MYALCIYKKQTTLTFEMARVSKRTYRSKLRTALKKAHGKMNKAHRMAKRMRVPVAQAAPAPVAQAAPVVQAAPAPVAQSKPRAGPKGKRADCVSRKAKSMFRKTSPKTAKGRGKILGRANKECAKVARYF
jgi:uncharacterized membrane protein